MEGIDFEDDSSSMTIDELLAYSWDLSTFIPEIPRDGIVSKTIHADSQINAVLFALDSGQSLQAHIAYQPAIIQILKGEAKIMFGNEVKETQMGSWVYIAPRVEHSVYARTPVILLLLLGMMG